MHSAIVSTVPAFVNVSSQQQYLPSALPGARGCENPAYDPFGYVKAKEVITHQFPDGVECFIDLGKASYGDISSDNVEFCLGESGARGVRGEGDHAKSAVASARRAKTQVRRKCKMIRANAMFTLTYRENVTDEARVQADFKAFRKRLSKLGPFHYVACLEKQQRGALHVHIACQGLPAFLMVDGVRVKSFNVLRAMWQRVVGRGMGACNVSRFRGKNSPHRIASYIAKYVAKGIEEGGFNKKSYWSSAGIPKPVVTRTAWTGFVAEVEIVTALYESWIEQGFTDIAQHYDALNGFYWFSASRP